MKSPWWKSPGVVTGEGMTGGRTVVYWWRSGMVKAMGEWWVALDGEDMSLRLERRLGDSELKVMGRSRDEWAMEFLCNRADRELPLLPLPGRGRNSTVWERGANGLMKDGE